MIRIEAGADLNWTTLYRAAYQRESVQIADGLLRQVEPVTRAMLLIRLVNFLGGRSGVRAELCRYLVDRLNDGFTPWVPSLGHGMAADAIANTHAFQTLIGEGFVYGDDDQRLPAATALANLGVEPFAPDGREGLALINGVCAAPALAVDAYHRSDDLLDLANLVAAVSMDGLAAPSDAIDPLVAELSSEAGIGRVVVRLRKHLAHSQVRATSCRRRFPTG